MYCCLYEVSNSICLANYARHATRFWGSASSREYAVEFSQKEFASLLLFHPLLESPVSLLLSVQNSWFSSRTYKSPPPPPLVRWFILVSESYIPWVSPDLWWHSYLDLCMDHISPSRQQRIRTVSDASFLIPKSKDNCKWTKFCNPR